jgi:hypothetical protein
VLSFENAGDWNRDGTAPLLLTHVFIATYSGYEIFRRDPGFEFTPVLLGKIASFLLRSQDGISGVAFMYPLLLGLDGREVDEAHLLDDALRAIEELIDQGQVNAWEDVTFERHNDAWAPVKNPPWWVSVLPDYAP